MSNIIKNGTCHICGISGPLSYEHVPPRAVFNDCKVIIYKGIDYIGRGDYILPWDSTGIKGEQKQRGIGDYTLCSSCNNFTGSVYGAAYKDFNFQAYSFAQRNFDKKQLICNFRDIYPLRLLKQILAMFFSVNSPNFSKKNIELREFVLNKYKKGINSDKYGLYIYLLKNRVEKRVGISGIVNIETHLLRLISEISTTPLGFILEIDPKESIKTTYNLCNIIGFGNMYNYDEITDLSLNLPILEVNTIYPGDYRTRGEIISNRLENIKKELENENKII